LLEKGPEDEIGDAVGAVFSVPPVTDGFI